MPRKDEWSEDELILSLYWYFRIGPKRIDGDKGAIEELRDQLNALNALPGESGWVRNTNTVRIRMANFKHHDEDWDGKGYEGGGAKCAAVFKRFASDRRALEREAQRIVGRIYGVRSGQAQSFVNEKTNLDWREPIARVSMDGRSPFLRLLEFLDRDLSRRDEDHAVRETVSTLLHSDWMEQGRPPLGADPNFSRLLRCEETSPKDWGGVFMSIQKSRAGMNGGFNLYPSEVAGHCQPLAVFVALDATPFKVRGLKTLSFAHALQAMVQHQQGGCEGTTREMLLVTSSWDAQVYQPWLGNFKRMATSCTIRMVQWTGSGWLESHLG